MSADKTHKHLRKDKRLAFYRGLPLVSSNPGSQQQSRWLRPVTNSNQLTDWMNASEITPRTYAGENLTIRNKKKKLDESDT